MTTKTLPEVGTVVTCADRDGEHMFQSMFLTPDKRYIIENRNENTGRVVVEGVPGWYDANIFEEVPKE